MKAPSVFGLGLLLCFVPPAPPCRAEPDAAPAARPLRPVHTYSIVARDPVTGELGVAVQSHWFAVGLDVPWAEAGVGAVATQSFVNQAYGLLGLDQMRAGKGAPEVLKLLLAKDNEREVRQVAMIDAQGRTAAHTGSKCIEAAGHFAGRNHVVQANLMSSDRIWPAMSAAFEGSRGDLAERMLAALEAGEKAGGDIRGRQSAALIVVNGKATGRPWSDRRFNLRVDDHPEPLKELRRLLGLQRAYLHMNAGDLAVERKDNEGALREYAVAERLAPDNPEMLFWHGVALLNMGKTDEAAPLLRKVWKASSGWKDLLPRLVKAGLLRDDPTLIKAVTK